MKRTWIAVLLSVIFPGFGHFYLGQPKKGVILVLADIISILLMSVIVGAFLLPIVYIYGIIDSYRATPKVNSNLSNARL
ncbi:sugar ABC transporter permease [Sediminibacillus albus]|uniref:TM2 domain-containing protein n=1 Tax=Sediminibacillus albus TaxID=407036 RepID=A0A1G9A4B6_9BACI|nr:sugar ABC transporter permease [Sediminibacillus albus]SDK21704.1 hypothetical protein SAMN05216243_2384 [Sediminibacillus albus]